MHKIKFALKAPFPAYAVLVCAGLINISNNQPEFTIEYCDESSVGQKKASVEIEGGQISGSVAGLTDCLNFLSLHYGQSNLGTLSNDWLNMSTEALAVKDFKKLSVELDKLESRLNYRSFLLGGYQPSLTDVTVWGALRANSVVSSSIKAGTYVNVSRWYLHLERVPGFASSVDKSIEEANEKRKAAKVGQKKESKASYEIGLPDAHDGQVVTRFPPEPSGYMHIGHAKAAILNQYFAELYHGKLIIRFDDTNPSKEKTEFQDSILEDCRLLGITADRVTHSSNYFQEMYEYAVQLIEKGLAYCDNTPQELMREQRGEGIASVCRDTPPQKNLEIFIKEMKAGTSTGQSYCLRAKISVDNPNKALRDPVIYRVNLTPHHRTGSTWKMYPTYDFCVPIVDALEGVTHALRTIEYRDRNPQYQWMLQALNLRTVHVWDFSRTNFVRTLLSKRKLQWFVDQGLVSGWDDPRFPTVRGVRRRGMTIEALRSFVISQGPSKNILNLEWSLIWAMNKKVIDPVAPRHTAVLLSDKVLVRLHGAGVPSNGCIEETRPKHKKNADIGMKKVIFSDQVLIDQDDARTFLEKEEITLMDWGNAIVEEIQKDPHTGMITLVEMQLHLEGDFKKTEKKVTWLANTPHVTNVDLVDFDLLITKDKLEEDDKVEDYLTKDTEFHALALADVNVRALKAGDVIQLERKGYYRVDVPWTADKPAVLFTIPDGKAVNRYGVKSK